MGKNDNESHQQHEHNHINHSGHAGHRNHHHMNHGNHEMRGVLISLGIVITPAIGAVIMSLSTIICAINAQLLKID